MVTATTQNNINMLNFSFSGHSFLVVEGDVCGRENVLDV